jgi:2-dehydro-3-deoxyphosphogluconate aldolase/(4S)-4-hydroxy-2-oxoglutarate aldolase
MNAEESGATLIKLFPGNILGPVFLSAIKELFPGLQFIPTGGVLLEKENLTSWFKSGVMAVGAGSTLVNKGETDAGDFTSLENSARKALQLISWVKINLPA